MESARAAWGAPCVTAVVDPIEMAMTIERAVPLARSERGHGGVACWQRVHGDEHAQ